MWKVNNGKNVVLFNPPVYVNKSNTTHTYEYYKENIVLNLSGNVFTDKYFAILNFETLFPSVYQDLDVYLDLLNISTSLSVLYLVKDFTKFDSSNCYAELDDSYARNKLPSLYINTDGNDIYAEVAYKVKNIETAANLTMFLAAQPLSIYAQDTMSSPKQLISVDFLNNLPITSETIVTFIYKFKIYDSEQRQALPLLNTKVIIDIYPAVAVEHQELMYQYTELLIHNSYVYKTVYSVEDVEKFIVNQHYRPCIIHSTHAYLIDTQKKIET